MKRTHWVILGVVLVGAGVAWYMYQKKHATASTATAKAA